MHAHMQHINKPVEIVECQYSKVDISSLLGITAFDLDKLLEMDPEFLVRVGDVNSGFEAEGAKVEPFVHWTLTSCWNWTLSR